MQSDCNRIFPIRIDYNRIGVDIIWINVLGEEILLPELSLPSKSKYHKNDDQYFL